MIFTTYKEELRVMGIIRERKLFDDLKQDQNDVIYGAYQMLEMVDSWLADYVDYDKKPLYEKALDSYLTEQSESLFRYMEGEIATMYVSFRDNNAVEEDGNECK